MAADQVRVLTLTLHAWSLQDRWDSSSLTSTRLLPMLHPMVQAIQQAYRLRTLHPMLILVAAVVGAEVEAQQPQTPIQIRSVAVDSVAVEPHLIPPLRLMEAAAAAAVIALRHQTLRHSHKVEAVEDLVPQHQMQVQALL